MNQVIREGYGPSGLVADLRTVPRWTGCIGGKNFDGVCIAGEVLTDPPDALCAMKYRVTVEAVPSIDSFTVEGYQSPQWGRQNPLKIAGSPVRDLTLQKLSESPDALVPYRITIEEMP